MIDAFMKQKVKNYFPPFFAFFAARFSLRDFAGAFLLSFFGSLALAMVLLLKLMKWTEDIFQ